MRQRCEVCENFRPGGDLEGGRKLLEVTFGMRPVLLCMGHALIAQNSGVTSFKELCELYGEEKGRRSFVQRRSRSTASERRSVGRRATDVR